MNEWMNGWMNKKKSVGLFIHPSASPPPRGACLLPSLALFSPLARSLARGARLLSRPILWRRSRARHGWLQQQSQIREHLLRYTRLAQLVASAANCTVDATIQGAGLSNLGNTCFLNAVLQCLTYTPPLAGYLESGQHRANCHAPAFCAMCALQEHVRQALGSSGGVVSPTNLVKNLRCISKSFRLWQQEDAHEYMRYLIEALHNCCLPARTATNSTSAQDRSLVHKIFGGRLRSQVKCTICSSCSNTYDPFLDLSLEIVRADSLSKALVRFTAVEALEGDNKYHCSNCQKKVRALKQFTIDKSPNILTIQFKRFSSTGNSGGKIDKKIEFGRTLDMKPYVSNPQDGDANYLLYAVLVHAGWSTHSGHYYCFVRTAGDTWHGLDDSRVKPVSERNVLDQKAYILFYIRDSPNRGSTGAQQSTLFSLFPACKQLLSDGASETTDDVDTLTDECDSDGCQARREGGYNVSHSYAYGGVSNEPQDGSDPGQTADTPKCCSHLRAVAHVAKRAVNLPEGDVEVGQSERRTEFRNLPDEAEATIEMKMIGLCHTQTGSVDKGSIDQTGMLSCSSSGKVSEDDDDWDDNDKKSNGATLHCYMCHSHMMPSTCCCLHTKAVPVHRDRKRVICMRAEMQISNLEGGVPYAAKINRRECKRSGSVDRADVMGKRLKQLDSNEKFQLELGIEATAPMQKQVEDCVVNSGLEQISILQSMEVDDSVDVINLGGNVWSLKKVQDGDFGKNSHLREFWDATSGFSPDVIRAATIKEHPDSVMLDKVCVEDLEFEARTGECSLGRIVGRTNLNMKSIITEEGSGHTGFSLDALQSNEFCSPGSI